LGVFLHTVVVIAGLFFFLAFFACGLSGLVLVGTGWANKGAETFEIAAALDACVGGVVHQGRIIIITPGRKS